MSRLRAAEALAAFPDGDGEILLPVIPALCPRPAGPVKQRLRRRAQSAVSLALDQTEGRPTEGASGHQGTRDRDGSGQSRLGLREDPGRGKGSGGLARS